MSIEYQLNVEIEMVEKDYNDGYISLMERNDRIRNLENQARGYESESNYLER